ncbi:hypothetical protein [Actinoplanes sp. L3-i22]|uniref:hypothetical protein n=1 Tax=Actinoplanes sp. L3-i22 TaxID=2836373 RepID=UPI001C84C164|nr:hypothetical protein [Actinoplanes sp. L3-i22]
MEELGSAPGRESGGLPFAAEVALRTGGFVVTSVGFAILVVSGIVQRNLLMVVLSAVLAPFYAVRVVLVVRRIRREAGHRP